MCATPWAEADANEFTDVDFDYAAILGYGIDQDGKPFLKALYFVPTDALLERQSPDENGVWKLPLATYYVHQLSLEPRNKFARFLYLIERICEGGTSLYTLFKNSIFAISEIFLFPLFAVTFIEICLTAT